MAPGLYCATKRTQNLKGFPGSAAAPRLLSARAAAHRSRRALLGRRPGRSSRRGAFTSPTRPRPATPAPPPPRSALLYPPIPRPTWRSVRPQRGPRPCLAPRARSSGGREPNADGTAVPGAPRASLDRGGPGTLRSAIPTPCKQVPPGGSSRPRGSGRPREVTPKVPKLGRGAGCADLSGARSHRTGPVTDRPRTAPPRPKSPRPGSPARPPPGQGGGAYPAFGRPRLQFAAPASGSSCGSRAPWPSAGQRGPRGRPAAEQPAVRGILAAAARGRRVPLNSTPPPLPPSLPSRRRHRGRARIPPLGWLRPGGRGRGAEQGACLRGRLRTAPRTAPPPPLGGAAP